MNEPLRISIRTYGGRGHQAGRGPERDGLKGSGFRVAIGSVDESETPGDPGIVHVQNGKPLTAKGKKLLGL